MLGNSKQIHQRVVGGEKRGSHIHIPVSTRVILTYIYFNADFIWKKVFYSF